MKLGQLIKDSALAGVTKGIRKTELNYNTTRQLQKLLGGSSKIFGGFNGTIDETVPDKTEKTESKTYKGNEYSYKCSVLENNQDNLVYADDPNAGNFLLKLPYWGYDDFINERNIWLKQITNKLNGPSLFYFKIFFEFNTNYGLFGGILNNNDHLSINSAYRYLNMWKNYYGENIEERMNSLIKFTQLLSYISVYSPWFFKSIKNVQNASNPYISEFGKEKSIDIEFEEEAIDMRISTLFSLYKYACFDDINCRELIPENLRKFNMTVVLFESPIKYIHTPISKNGKTISKNFKTLYGDFANNNDSVMSYKVYTFKNCEFSSNSINGYIANDMSNESGFILGKNSLKITYDRVYEHIYNEYMGLLVGSDGIYYTNDGEISTIQTYNDIHDAMLLSQNIQTASEKLIRDNIQNILGHNSNYALGNIFGEDVKLYNTYSNMSIDRTNPITAKNNFTEYTKMKFGMYTPNKFNLVNLGFNMLYKWLGSDYHAGSVSGINDVGTVLSGSTVEGGLRLGSVSYNDKLRRIKFGSKAVPMSNRNARMNIESAAKNLRYSLPNAITKNALNKVSTGKFVN